MHTKSILDIAFFFINKSHEEGSVITQLKLQKLCYYAQAWRLALTGGTQLFAEDFEAWIHGPANYTLYSRYKRYGWGNINEKTTIDKNKFESEEIDFLDDVWNKYGMFDAKVLENLTHLESPWIDARAGLSEYENSNNIISKESMIEYYRSMLVG
ncbi:Panacea domain-containing protein [Paenibacillus sp. WLX2291]|uniref:Panacea domain-containing protein n=1 Tax=Paenibacillus sp. WLX2291 TaxID=3296934 RepID=UPI0039842F63